MGFGLNVALAIMQVSVDTVLEKDESIFQAISAYIDDINEDVKSETHVRQYLDGSEVTFKDPKQLQDNT